MPLATFQTSSKHHQRSIFYVFPSIGETLELDKNSNLIQQSQLLDVCKIPLLKLPTKKDGQPRKGEFHYADVIQGKATLHSEPIEVELLSAFHLAQSNFSGTDGLRSLFNNFYDFWEFRRLLHRTSIMVVV